MCGRINIAKHPLAEVFMELAGQPFPVEDRENLAPTEPAPVIRNVRSSVGSGREVAVMRWWLIPYWSREPKTRYAMFNAKAETLTQSRAFEEPFARRRCIVPVSGFYEWEKQSGRKLPYYIRSLDDSGLLLAGVWDRWRSAGGGARSAGSASGGARSAGIEDQTIESFAIITVPAHRNLEFIHDRQPAMLSREAVDEWLDRGTPRARLQQLLAPALPAPLAAVPVSTYVNTSKNQGPRCIDPIAPAIELPAD